jgi:hypothetical protein
MRSGAAVRAGDDAERSDEEERAEVSAESG